MKTLKWLDKNFELLILSILLAIMSVLSITNVFMRYCMQHALSWSDEVCCYCLALSAFFSLPCAIRLNTSIKVDTFVMLLPEKIRKILGIVCNCIMVVFLFWITQGCVQMTENAHRIGQASPALRIPLYWLYGAMTFAIILGLLRYIQVIFKTILNKKLTEEE